MKYFQNLFCNYDDFSALSPYSLNTQKRNSFSGACLLDTINFNKAAQKFYAFRLIMILLNGCFKAVNIKNSLTVFANSKHFNGYCFFLRRWYFLSSTKQCDTTFYKKVLKVIIRKSRNFVKVKDIVNHLEKNILNFDIFPMKQQFVMKK